MHVNNQKSLPMSIRSNKKLSSETRTFSKRCFLDGFRLALDYSKLKLSQIRDNLSAFFVVLLLNYSGILRRAWSMYVYSSSGQSETCWRVMLPIATSTIYEHGSLLCLKRQNQLKIMKTPWKIVLRNWASQALCLYSTFTLGHSHLSQLAFWCVSMQRVIKKFNFYSIVTR